MPSNVDRESDVKLYKETYVFNGEVKTRTYVKIHSPFFDTSRYTISIYEDGIDELIQNLIALRGNTQ